ncbi:hypothetical protein V1478_007796 [Vespula squamosa]|uniref:Uncharacterized protein n=1 Tax=Vespula squamosa TaxID=30214 RepID=A0ABD2AWZ5_VESSQ
MVWSTPFRRCSRLEITPFSSLSRAERIKKGNGKGLERLASYETGSMDRNVHEYCYTTVIRESRFCLTSINPLKRRTPRWSLSKLVRKVGKIDLCRTDAKVGLCKIEGEKEEEEEKDGGRGERRERVSKGMGEWRGVYDVTRNSFYTKRSGRGWLRKDDGNSNAINNHHGTATHRSFLSIKTLEREREKERREKVAAMVVPGGIGGTDDGGGRNGGGGWWWWWCGGRSIMGLRRARERESILCTSSEKA